MAIAYASLTSGTDTSNFTSHTTASITPTANALVLLAALNYGSTNPLPIPTISGNGLTWTRLESIYFDDTGTFQGRLSLWWAMGASPSAGTVTIDYAGISQNGAYWSVVEFTGVPTTAGGADAIRQKAYGTSGSGGTLSSTATVNLGAFQNTANATYCCAATNTNGVTNHTPGSGFTEAHDVATNGDGGGSLASEYRLSNDTVADMTWDGGATLWAAIALEIGEGPGASTAWWTA